ncbi:LOW QUALITY PROTEIN: testis-expressed protein 19 [Prionailurus viverrinus]|uniref:LOW QUALITY PROTEIN: testis-expressed protein 19 n=1 Tax=Prionailurus viverrinus TaxID=61388 RepID=UPI001FF37D78|nr:LOW QUALITY PROTEIN: testis-expressed protein 19 [Prionailurus viverrinus]
MCRPVSVRYGDEGVSYLRASWRYQLRHGGQLGICFACFKAAFLELRDSLESEDWEEGDWDPEPTDPRRAGPEQGRGPGVGLSWGQGQGRPAQEGVCGVGGGPPHPPPPTPGSEEERPDHHFAPTELEPQDAAPRGQGPEDAGWTQSLPWRLGGPPRLRTLAEAPSSVAGASQSGPAPGGAHGVGAGHHAGRGPRRGRGRGPRRGPGRGRGRGLGKGPAAPLRGGLLRCRLPPEDDDDDAGVGPAESPGKCWKVLLEPDEVWAVGPQDAPQKQDLHRWKLRVLESSPPGRDEELVPADTALLKRGLAILSSSPGAGAGAGEGGTPPPTLPASPGPPASSSHGWDPGTTEPEPGSSGPSGGSLAAVGASALGELARFQPFGRGPQNGGPEAQVATVVLAAPSPRQPGEPPAKNRGAGAWGRRMGSCVGTEDRDRLCLRGRDPFKSL